MTFIEGQKERARKYEYLKKGEIGYPLEQIGLALLRLKVKDKSVQELAKRLEAGDISVLPEEVIGRDKEGEIILRISGLKDKVVLAKLKKIPDGEELLRILDKDLTLAGQESVEIKNFQDSRRKTTSQVIQEMRGYLEKSVDYNYELADEPSRHPFETPELKESYEILRSQAQEIADNLFKAVGLKRFKPTVHLTRSKGANAWIFSQEKGQAMREYLESSQAVEPPVELPIFIHFGIFKELKTKDELAALLAHEISHLLQPDYLGNPDSDQLKRLENDADATGMQLADAAGYNPRGMIELMKQSSQRERDTYFLQILFSDTHPPTEHRIIELEKLFHRPELPLPNAAKKMREYPSQILEAIKKIDSWEKKMPEISALPESNEKGVLEKALQEITAGPDFFLKSKTDSQLKERGESRLREAYLAQELAHNTWCYRESLIHDLKTFLVALNYRMHHKKGEEEYDFNIPTEQIYPLSEEVLKIPKEESYLPPKIPLEVLKLLMGRACDYYKNKREVFARDLKIEEEKLRANTLDDWLEENNPDTAPFWEFAKERMENRWGAQGKRTKKILASREGRLGYLNFLLREYMFGEGKDFLTANVIKKQIIKKKVPEITKEEGDQILAKVPLVARVQRLKEKKGQEIIEKEIEETTWQTINLLKINSQWIQINYRPWEYKPEEQPPLVQELLAIIEEKTIEAYQEVLKKDNFGQASPEVLRFILANLLGEGRGKYADPSPLLSSVEKVSFSFLDEAVRILESKSLDNFFLPAGGVAIVNQEKVEALKKDLILLIAFALKANSPQEIELQNKYRRRLETDLSLGEHLRPEKRIGTWSDDYSKGRWDKRFIGFPPEGKEGWFSLKIREAITSATNERFWAENKEQLLKILKTNQPLEDPDAPLDFHLLDIREEDKPKIEYLIKQSFHLKRLFVKEALLKAVNRLQVFLGASRGWVELMYKQGALRNSTVFNQTGGERRYLQDFLLSKSGHWELLEPLIEEAAKIFENDFKTLTHRTVELEQIEDFLWKLIRESTSMTDQIRRTQQLDSLSTSPSAIKTFEEVKKNAKHSSYNRYDDESFLLYRPSATVLDKEAYFSISDQTLFRYLDWKTVKEPAAKELTDELLKWKKAKKDIPDNLKSICLGQMRPFERIASGVSNVAAPDLIRLWQKAGALYKKEWGHLEQYKRLDEQLSYWEWRYNNPLITTTIIDEQARPAKKKEEFPKAPIIEYLEKNFGPSLREIYQIDTRNVEDIQFSWPLFLQDLWQGKPILEGKFSDEPAKEKKKNEVMEKLRAELKRLVDNPHNLEVIKKMQPGFFKEFILDKKMMALGVASLEEIEKWLPYLSARAHEASQRNQISSQIEARRWGVRDERKEEIMKQVLAKHFNEDEQKFISIKTNLDKALTDFAINLELAWKAPAPLTDKLEAVKKEIYQKYFEWLQKEEKEMSKMAKAKESEVLVFSDQMIENDKSRLVIGPVYRLRWLSQPLMDRHIKLLKMMAHSGLGPTESLFERIDKNLPERHPLKDVFVKNQLQMEIWQILKEAVDEAQLKDSGLELKEKNIDLKEALEKFPLYHDISFLKNYTLFEIEGLAGAMDKIPKEVAEKIVSKIEQAVEERISPDQKPVLRRLLFALEEKVRWPDLKKKRERNPAVFQEYLKRLLHFYSEPTWERDDLLEKIGMDLAQTPEEIRKVWSLRYSEQVRWPQERESVALRTQYEAFEKFRAMVSTLNTVERMEYIIWMLGGREPLSEKLSVKETNISLAERSELLWQMTPTERRALLYDILIGQDGPFAPNLKADSLGSITEALCWHQPHDTTQRHPDKFPWPYLELSGDYIRYLADEIFKQTFGEQLLDSSLPPEHETNKRGQEMLKLIFRELFAQQREPARQAELLINIIEAVGKAKKESRDLNIGELIRVMLEQVGVVGIKAGQILSEQPGLLPDSIRQELANLKDQTSPFSKRGILSYLESAGWVKEGDEKIKQIGELLGSASIKEVLLGRLKNDTEVAIKAKRPTIDKNFEQDLEVLKNIFDVLRRLKFEVPAYLLTEIERVVRDELSFTHETDNQIAMGKSLEARRATIGVLFGKEYQKLPLTVSAPLTVSEVYYPQAGSEEDIGLMIEQYVRGFSLKELLDYQKAKQENDQVRINKTAEKIVKMYGQSRLEEIEKKIIGLDLERLQAELGLEMIRQVVKGGVFHADLHAGNFYLDLTPFTKEKELFAGKGIFIDLGAVGFSDYEAMPKYAAEKYAPEYDSRDSFRDFVTALFAPSMHYDTIAKTVNKYTGFSWRTEDVERLVSGIETTEGKVKKIFYAILDQGGGELERQFGYFLKTLVSGADNLDKLKRVVQKETGMTEEDVTGKELLLTKLTEEGLINIDLLF